MDLLRHSQHIGFDTLPTDRPWRVKLGMDPTAPDLHLGHAVLLRKMRQFQDAGHLGVLVVGSFTAQIGDPTGKNKTRPPLTNQQVVSNASTYIEQAFKILDPVKTEVVHNDAWLGALSAVELTQLMAKVTVSQLMARDDFSQRAAANEPIALHELLYPVLQGMDSVHLYADIELGGRDQWFNLHMGRALQEKHGQPPQALLAMPLLVGLDGVHKMSKSLDNHIGLTMDPVESFGRWMSVSDTTMWTMLPLLDVWDDARIATERDACFNGLRNPMDVKMDAGLALLTLLHGVQSARDAQDAFLAKHRNKTHEFDTVVREFPPGTSLPVILRQLGFADSNMDAVRKMAQGGVRVDGVKVMDKATVLGAGTHRIEVGKRQGCTLQLTIAPMALDRSGLSSMDAAS